MKITREVIIRFFLTDDDLYMPSANDIESSFKEIIEDWGYDFVDCKPWLIRTVTDDVFLERG